jgi:nicotinamidase-related amidase
MRANHGNEVAARPFPVALDPRETAVIVVDMQQGFFGAGGGWNRAGLDVTGAHAIVAPIARVLKIARAVGIPVIYATMDLDNLGAGAKPGYWTQERLSRWLADAEPRQPLDDAGRLYDGAHRQPSFAHQSRGDSLDRRAGVRLGRQFG